MSVSLGFELLVQAALGFVSQSAIKSIIYTVSKQISPSGGRPDGSALWTPASLSGKRLDLNPLPCSHLC